MLPGCMSTDAYEDYEQSLFPRQVSMQQAIFALVHVFLLLDYPWAERDPASSLPSVSEIDVNRKQEPLSPAISLMLHSLASLTKG